MLGTNSDIFIDLHFCIDVLTTFAGISENPWLREKSWLDMLPLDDADRFLFRGAPVVEEPDRPKTVLVLPAIADLMIVFCMASQNV